ncbi:hypothetical protein KL912_003823 [Ogataea haglerorum]|nr:hypothetical protein KL912_003823 [Ogataea haglerorum]
MNALKRFDHYVSVRDSTENEDDLLRANRDLKPTPPQERTWRTYNYIVVWFQSAFGWSCLHVREPTTILGTLRLQGQSLVSGLAASLCLCVCLLQPYGSVSKLIMALDVSILLCAACLAINGQIFQTISLIVLELRRGSWLPFCFIGWHSFR